MSLSLLLNTNFLEKTLDDSKTYIQNDRNNFSLVWNIIENYCKENQLIISNKYILCEKNNNIMNICDKVYKIYTNHPFKYSNNLTNLLHEKSKNINIKLRTIIEHEELIIEYDTRIVCIFYKLYIQNNLNINDIIKPVNKNNLLYIPSELELIDTYHNLYIMNNINEETKFEDILFKQVENRKDNKIIGSALINDKKELFELIKVRLIQDWMYNKKTNKPILIGPWAYDWINLSDKELNTNLEKIQIIYDITPKELLNELKIFINKITNYNITFKKQELDIPKDFRTIRYTYYLHIKTKKGIINKPFLDLFNNSDFELIPYVEINNIFIGQKYLILRILFLDLWTIRVIKSLGLIDKLILNKKISYLWNLILYFRNEFKDNLKINFIGTFKDYKINKSMDILEKKIINAYYPELYFNENNKYRLF